MAMVMPICVVRQRDSKVCDHKVHTSYGSSSLSKKLKKLPASAVPTGIVVGRDGAVYVTNKGVLVGAGEVLRIAP